MPEDPEVRSFHLRSTRGIQRVAKKQGGQPTARLIILPRSWAEGTWEKPYSTISEDRSRFNEALEPPDPEYAATCNAHDLRSAKLNGCLHLLDRPLQPGPIYVAKRGKCLVIAAGYHAVSINFGLEASLWVVSRSIFDDLLENDAPGPNPDKAKAQRLRTFLFPEYLIEPSRRAPVGSRNTQSINIFCAWLVGDSVIIISDFSRLVRLHFTSLDRFWTQDDLNIGSYHWRNTIFSAFPDGPDMVLEPIPAREALLDWRRRVLDGTASGTDAIVKAITTNKSMAFGGFGRHLANDFLHVVKIPPLLSARTVCQSDRMFDSIMDHIFVYMAQWSSDRFIKQCCTDVNSLNPFTFNASQERNYHSGYVYVHAKDMVRVTVDEYNGFVELGYLDPDHTIGAFYTFISSFTLSQCEPLGGGYKFLKVHQYEEVGKKRPLRAFSVILAKFPKTDMWRPSTENWTDIRMRGLATTLGPASFREAMQNRPLFGPAVPKLVRGPGRPAKPERTGKGGRPRTSTCEAQLQIPKYLTTGRKRKRSPSPEPEPEPEPATLSPRKTRSSSRRKTQI
ncbi:hypothetical protein FA13DRAFT_1867608 [Coprinellus micaceus]|uniref:Uncharacterized protein n=1 Tax=Coprinellus micaceus TaxID=71717 RepID=A0A4Y7TUH3_COPMI|nr:hypothetical protein FA13DRAFT_1867608 [Coprinellus micaceus]